jgi:hypothetical protein
MTWVVPGQAEQLIRDAELNRHDLTRFWQASLPLTDGEQLKALHLVDENLYCVTTEGTLFAVHRDVGIIRWSVDLVASAYTIFKPAHLAASPIEGHAAVATTGTLFFLDRRSGREHRRIDLAFPVGSGPVTDGNVMLLTSVSGQLHCMQLPEFFPKWHLAALGGIHHAPVLWESRLFFTSGDGGVVSCTADNKVALWTSELRVPIEAGSVVTAQAGMLVPAGDRSLYQFNLEDGVEPEWRARFGNDLRESPAVSLEGIYQPVVNEGIFVLTMEGNLAWRWPEGRRFLTEINELAFMLNDKGDVQALHRTSGKPRYVLPASDVALTVSNPVGAAMYVGSEDGRLLCVRSKDAPYLRTDQVQAALRGPVPAGEPAEAAAADAVESEPAEESTDAAADSADADADNPLKTRIRTKPLSGRAVNP